MEIRLTPDLEAKLQALARASGRAPDELVQEAVAGYVDDLADVRATLDRRYDDLTSGRVTPLDGEAFFEGLRQREDDLLKRRAPQ
jgi:predicted transcriptional regulator